MRESYSSDQSGSEYWNQVGADYGARIDNAYHQHRTETLRTLIEPFDRSLPILDFGCGDAVTLASFNGTPRIGIDVASDLLVLAKKRVPDARLILGGVDKMREIEDQSVDAVVSFNVNAYLSAEEDRQFYIEAHRILQPGGVLAISHSNELFDLFTLNAYTSRFFKNHFGSDADALLLNPKEPESVSFNIRENPLAYKAKLESFGFVEERQVFVNFHARPPSLMDKSVRTDERPEYRDTFGWPDKEAWKLMFQCSTFGSRAVRA